MFHPRTRVGPAKVIIFGTFGFAIGLFLGYIFMGTTHAVRITLLIYASVNCKRVCLAALLMTSAVRNTR